MNTRISKGRNGWEVCTRIDMGDDRLLVIDTYKTFNGSLVTQARGKTVEGDFLVWSSGTDYSKRLAVSTPKRLTAKVAEEQHNKALQDIAVIRADFKNHYEMA